MLTTNTAILSAIGSHALDWDGDNRVFVVETLLPHLALRPKIKQVIRWAYGYDGADRSYEMESDGSSVVPDLFMGGIIKEPFGVGHDMIYILNHEDRVDPSGHTWGWMESNKWYHDAMVDFGYPVRAKVRLAGLTIGSWWAWIRKQPRHKGKRDER